MILDCLHVSVKFVLLGLILVLAVSYNLPKFIGKTCWNADAATSITNISLSANNPMSLFLTKNNTWYVVLDGYAQIFSGNEGSIHSTTSASGAFSVFVTGDDNVYTSDSGGNRVNMWSMNLTSSQPVMLIGNDCRDLFVDTNSTLYCCLDNMHQVVAKSLLDPKNALTRVAGTGCFGSQSRTLTQPSGIFVDFNFTLYVADSGNNRIQRFTLGQRNATTIAGDEATGTISLNNPVDVVLDGDGYIFIVDSGNNRVVGSGPDGFRCVAGCINGYGSASDQLLKPMSMSFDSNGNIWVADLGNHRIQKFFLKTNCSRGTFLHIPFLHEEFLNKVFVHTHK